MSRLKNDIILRVLKGEKTERPPVWMMRQAGRYLPEYMALRNRYGFFERCQNPELACEITLQPVDIIGVDAAILFSDILVVPQAMGLEVQLIESQGPVLPQPLKTQQDLSRIRVPDVEDSLHYVFDAIRLIKKELNGLVEDSLKKVGLWEEVKDRLHQSALTLSGGQQQRLCIARAIAVKPKILLLDEPTSALDPVSTAKIEELVRELKEEFTIVMVTHNMQQAARVSDYTAYFYMGRLIEWNETRELFTRPGKKETGDYLTGRFG